MRYDDVLVIKDVYGDEEKVRVLWKCGTATVRVKSLTRPHKKAFTIKNERIIRNESQVAREVPGTSE